MFITKRKIGIKPLHVFDRVNGDAAFADLAENAVSVAVQTVERGAVEGGAESNVVLVLSEIMKTAIGVLGEPQTGEQAGGFLQL